MTKNLELKDIEALLNQVKTITEHHDKIAEERGEKFNVFDIIGIRNSEVKMHSAMLRNLLDVKGSHGMKDTFLELFIEEMKAVSSMKESEFSHTLDIKNSEAIAEECAGPKDEDSGGRIDLYISDNVNNAIIIENKIYAVEQENQLIRYENYNSNAPIIFLTLEGSQPNSINDEKTGKDISTKVFCISYRKNIINWLENCKKEATDKPLLREGIKHYMNLIKILTNQTMENAQKRDMQYIVDKNIDSIRSLLNVYTLIQLNNFDNMLKFIIKILTKLDLYDPNLESRIPQNIGIAESEIVIFKTSEFLIYLCFNIRFDKEEELGKECNMMLFIEKYKIDFSESEKTKLSKVGSIENPIDFSKHQNKDAYVFTLNVVEYNKVSWDKLTEEINISSIVNKIRSIKEALAI